MAMKVKSLNTLALAVVAAFVIALAVKFSGVEPQKANAGTDSTPPAAVEEQIAEPAPVAEDQVAPDSELSSEQSPPLLATDIKAALADRAMGDEKAPVTVEEYASLTCSHCAHFSKTTFDKFKEKYIDTGKVRYIYRDYPLNGPALEASMVARCLPAERYFQFVKFLFETQNEWAFGNDYREKLKKDASLLGLGNEAYDACVANNAIKDRLGEVMQKANKDHGIEATPTFIVNGREKLSGARDLPDFEKIIDPLLETK